MIYDSTIWKEKLFKIATSLYKGTQWKRFRNGQEALIEEKVFLSAYIIRKLFEAKKLSYYLTNASIKIIKYENKKPVDLMNWHRLDDLYNLEKPKNSIIEIRYLVNFIIHSFVFFPCRHGKAPKLDGFFVTSDRFKNKYIIYVNIFNFIGLLEIIANDEKVAFHIKRNEKLDYEEDDPFTNNYLKEFELEMSKFLEDQNISDEERIFFIKQREQLINERKVDCEKHGIISETFL